MADASGNAIPTPGVVQVDKAYYDELYSTDIRKPRRLITTHPIFETENTEYDLDSEDEGWVSAQPTHLELTLDKFEDIMDRLERGSCQTVITLQEAKAVIKQDADLITVVYDYWLTKRLTKKNCLTPVVCTTAKLDDTNDPYVAFRRNVQEKVRTRKGRKKDEIYYTKMLTLKTDLTRVLGLLDVVRRREKCKREDLQMSIKEIELIYKIGDCSGVVVPGEDSALTDTSYRVRACDETETSPDILLIDLVDDSD